MVDPGWALQKAVYARLTSDAAVMAALGGAKVYDHVPRRTPKPYVTFGRNVVRDFSTSDAEAHEHDLVLHVWAGAKGRKETRRITFWVSGRARSSSSLGPLMRSASARTS